MSALLEARGIQMRYPIRHGLERHSLHAVEDVDLSIGEGECVGLVGESGCGKSTLARIAARLIEPTAGSLTFAGEDIARVPLRRFARDRHRADIQMIFQDAMESLNPTMTVFEAIADPLRRLRPPASRSGLSKSIHEVAAEVGIAANLLQRFPHQLSGGQRARVGIARAIVLRPKLLILDEPTAALDASVQSTILHLLHELRIARNMSYLFVSHDLNVVRLICSRVMVMYLGRIVETAPAAELFERPSHPYTRALLASIPDPHRNGPRKFQLAGMARSPIDPDPNVCRLHGRCPAAIDRCQREYPSLVDRGRAHSVACHAAELADAVMPPVLRVSA